MRTEGMKTIVAVAVAAVLSACATTPEFRDKRREELAMWKAEFIDARRTCHASGGFMVQYPPENGGRYRCVR
jgi:starvation-inducible outer membrane lipoprotein